MQMMYLKIDNKGLSSKQSYDLPIFSPFTNVPLELKKNDWQVCVNNKLPGGTSQ